MTHEQSPLPEPKMLKPAPDDLIGILDAQQKEHGDTFPIEHHTMGRIVVTAHPNGIQDMLRHQNYRRKAEPLSIGVIKVLGHNVLTNAGDEWERSREVINPSLAYRQVQNMTPIIAAVGSDFFGKLSERYADGQPFDVLREMNALARQTLSAVFFAGHADALRELDPTMTAAFKLIDDARHEMGDDARQHLDTVTSELRDGAGKIIETARSQEPDTSLPSRLAYSGLDRETAINEQNIMMFAGEETTGLALTWILDILQKYPNIKDRMQDEIHTVLGGRRLESQDIKHLRYTRQVIKEGLRVRPPVSLIGRVAEKADILDGVNVGAGDIILSNIHGVHHNEKFWSNPYDVDPDRFASRPIDYSYLPFGGGDRVCIGRGLALSEIAIHLAILFDRYDVEVVSGQTRPQFRTVSRPDIPVKATIRPLTN